MTAPATRPFHRLRWAVRHPVRTLRRNHDKSVSAFGFGLLMVTIVGLFLAAVGLWVWSMPWPEHTVP
ncbi:hypothetical protein ACIO3O_37430 [Streptomyces sp. NPDC087440]|uniref:hypothetical protein n=1 Tax=Streptomyces sp. NPDC087440 TaxID=3365790 RepID=UPI00381595EF